MVRVKSMNLNLKGKIALVTGGAQGIGKAITRALVEEGAFVYFTSRDASSLHQLESEFRGRGEGCMTSLKNPEMLVKGIRAPDILVNNAGSTFGVQDPYCSDEDLDKVFWLNFKLPRQLSNLVIPTMKERGWGRIVNIASCSGLENRGPVTFCCAKAALIAYTRSMGRVLAIEAPGIVMSTILPGVVLTEGGHWANASKEHADKYLATTPLKRFGRPEEIAPSVVFHCSDLASFSHGAIVPVDAGLSPHFFNQVAA